jgi:diaminopimelate decarboxylase
MPFRYGQDGMSCEDVPLARIAAEAGTPCYVYSAAAIVQRFRAYTRAIGDTPHQICYAVKANSNLSILRLLRQNGSGFDIVSGGELFRVLQAGGDPGRVVFSGVGKTDQELEYGLREGIGMFNCESEAELSRLNCIAGRLGVRAPTALRVNPDVDAATHPYISTGLSDHKFGVDIAQSQAIYSRAAQMANLEVHGVSCHIGSQILQPAPLLEAVDRMLALVDRLQGSGIPIRHLDLGGGLGVPYRPGEEKTPIEPVMQGITDRVRGRALTISVEPGRSIVAEAGVLLTKVLYRKASARKQFIIVDAAMNDLIRPALYKSYHEIEPVTPHRQRELITADVVGPVCESGDFLAHGRDIEAVEEGELLAVRTAGAYGFVQSSNYNSRPRAAEVLVEGDRWRIIRKRETYEDLIRGE